LGESKQVLKLFVASHNYTLVMEEAEQLPIFRPIMPRQPKPLPTWEICVAKAKAKHLGTVEAADAEAAVEAAAEEFKVDTKRLMAVRRA
jgi:hypothetical protein